MPGYPYATPVTLDELWKNILYDQGIPVTTETPTPLEMKTILTQLDLALATVPGANLLTYAPAGALSQTIDRRYLNGTFQPASGTLYMALCYIPAGTVISNFNTMFAVGDAGPTQHWYGLYSSARVQLAVTASTATAVTANTLITKPVATTAAGSATSFTTTYSGLYYIGGCLVTGNAPTWYNLNQTNANPEGIAPIISGSSDTGQTTPPAFPHTGAAITDLTGLPWFYLT